MEKRRRALEKVRARFEGKPFAWGRNDCLILARAMLAAMGHVGLPKVPRYRTALGAKKALKSLGADTVPELLDTLLPRIVPAQMLPGDLALVESEEEGFGGTVMIGLGWKLWGWHPDADAFAVVDPAPDAIQAAWRV